MDDQYGRLWEIPIELAGMGHDVKGICLSYRRRNQGAVYKSEDERSIDWYSFNVMFGFLKYLRNLRFLLKAFRPDVILASSDCFHVIWGVVLGKLYKIPCVADLYDNYESYGSSKVALISPVYRYALQRADGVSCVSKSLGEFITNRCQSRGELRIIGNAINRDLFYPRDFLECRAYFNIANDVKVIGTAGHLSEKRGISNLYRAFEEIAGKHRNLYLALAGVGSRTDPVFRHPNVIDFGVLPYSDVPKFLGMLDISVICNSENDFGSYCYPQKANEILACKIPIVAAKVGVMADLLCTNPECLFNPEDPSDLAAKLQQQLLTPKKLDIPIDTWTGRAEEMDALMNMIVHDN